MQKLKNFFSKIHLLFSRNFNDSILNNLIFIKKKLKCSYATIIIEPVNFCNIRCPLCTAPFWKANKEKKVLSLKNFIKIIHNLDIIIPKIYFSLGGEPLINKDIFTIIKYSKLKHYKTIISTNATLLNKIETRKKLLLCGLDHLIISFDGFDKKSFETIRKGANFENTLNNITNLLNEKKILNSKTFIEIQFIITSLNEKHINIAQKYFNSLGAHFRTKPLMLSEHVNIKNKKIFQYLLPKNTNLKNNYLQKKIHCTLPQNTVSVFANGNVGICCADYKETYIYGNLLNSKLSKILSSKKYLRDFKLSYKRNLSICKNCPS